MPLASVHSRVTMQRTPFFLAQTVTWRGASGFGFGAGASLKFSRHPRKADVKACIAADCSRNAQCLYANPPCGLYRAITSTMH